MGTVGVIVLAVGRFLGHDLAIVELVFGPSDRRRQGPGARQCSPAWNSPIRTPSLEVMNVAGDSAVGRDRIQSAPNLRRFHAKSAQQHRRRIW